MLQRVAPALHLFPFPAPAPAPTGDTGLTTRDKNPSLRLIERIVHAANADHVVTRRLIAEQHFRTDRATPLPGGIFQVSFGFMNIASYVKYFPYPVISGFMSGVGLIIAILQISGLEVKTWGYKPETSGWGW